MLPPNLVASHGCRLEGPRAGALRRCRLRGKSSRARARAVLARTVLGRSRRQRTRARSSKCPAMSGRKDPASGRCPLTHVFVRVIFQRPGFCFGRDDHDECECWRAFFERRSGFPTSRRSGVTSNGPAAPAAVPQGYTLCLPFWSKVFAVSCQDYRGRRRFLALGRKPMRHRHQVLADHIHAHRVLAHRPSVRHVRERIVLHTSTQNRRKIKTINNI